MGDEGDVSINTLWGKHFWMKRLEGCRRCSILCSLCFCRSLVSPLQARADGQQQPEENQEGHAPVGIHDSVHGTEEVRKTSDERVGFVQTSSRPPFLQLPVPPDTERHGDPHRQAAEEPHHLWQAFAFIRDAAVLFLLIITENCPGISCSVRPQQPDQGLRSDQKRGEEQHGSVGVAEEEQETQGDDVTWWVQLSQPGLQDTKETQESCGITRESAEAQLPAKTQVVCFSKALTLMQVSNSSP